jgi:DEAD/DEAH box helicase domain-containing protein
MDLTLGFPEFPQALAAEHRPALEAALTRFHAALDEPGSPVRAIRHEPATDGVFRNLPEALDPVLRQALDARGIHQLYCHQAEAFELITGGQNVVVVTPTASAKTLCYNLPVLNLLPRNSTPAPRRSGFRI